MLSANERALLSLLEQDPFQSQQDLADQLGLPRSTVASLISGLVSKKYLLGRAYVLNQQADVICIGGMNVDRKYVLTGEFTPKTSNPVSSSLSLGGVARNIAENLGRLGQTVSLLSVAGRDHDYDWIRQQSEPYINFQQVTQLDGQATSSYTAILDQDGDMQLGLADMGICEAMTPDWLAGFVPLLRQAKLLVLDLNVPLATTAAAIELARKEDLPLVIIPVSSPKMAHLPRDLRGVTWLVVNQDESETFFDRQVETEADLESLADAWLATGLEQVLITRGKWPSYYASQSGERGYFKPPLVDQVVDVTGAGDSFSAGIIYGHLQGKTAQEAIAYGLSNAYHTVQSQDSVRKDLSADQLEQDVINLKEKGAI